MNELYHHGIKGQKWGVRRYQNKDGTYTELGKRHNFEKIEKAASERGIRTVRKKSLKPSLLLKLPKDTQIKRLQDILLLASK